MACILSKNVFILIKVFLPVLAMKNGMKIVLKNRKEYSEIFPGWKLNDGCRSNRWYLLNNNIESCASVEKDEGNCTIISGSFELKQINQLFASIETETRTDTCSSRLEKRKCKNTFDLIVYYGNNGNIFTHVEHIDALPIDSKPMVRNDKFSKSYDVLSFKRNKNYNYLKLGLQSMNYCGTVKSIVLFYYLCNPRNLDELHLLDLPETNAPSEASSPLIIYGKCVKNAVQKVGSSPLIVKCHYNGSSEILGKCVCKPGYTNIKRKCIGTLNLYYGLK